jgi:hypothetical protein
MVAHQGGEGGSIYSVCLLPLQVHSFLYLLSSLSSQALTYLLQLITLDRFELANDIYKIISAGPAATSTLSGWVDIGF